MVGALIAGFLLTWLMGVALIRLGPALGYIDHPDDPTLKVHDRPAVPLGGVTILIGVAGGAFFAETPDWPLLSVASLVVVLGLVDDQFSLKASVRLLAEAGIGLTAVSLEVVPYSLADPIDTVAAVTLIVVAINSVNLFDGLDGLAGSAASIGLAGLAALATMRGLDGGHLLIVTAAIVGFLLHNLPPASLFLGDNGSYLIGFLLAVGILGSSPDGTGSSLLVASLTLGVFLLDLAVTVLRRYFSGRPLFLGDRSHLYDRLHAVGWSIPRVVAAAVVIEAGFVGIALALDTAGSPPLGLAVVAAVGLVAVVALSRSSERWVRGG